MVFMKTLTRLLSLQWLLPLVLASSITLSPKALAGGEAVNTVNDGAIVNSGTYYNTAGDKTTFVNSAKTGLYVAPGSTVVGREYDVTTMQETGNGGNLHFSAPGQIVRIDGNLDVSGLTKGCVYIGNGGKVTIDSAFLYQNGHIFANGINGGQVQMNVGSMAMGPGANTIARGYGGAGGTVVVNATGSVTIPQGAVVDTSGGVVGTFNSNLIEVTGSVVNLDGILQANGLGAGQAGGRVQLTGTNRVTIEKNGKVVANGADAAFSPANPSGVGGKGGTISITAKNVIENNGLVAVNGGQGATFQQAATGVVSADYDAQGREIYQSASGTRLFKDPDSGVFFDACDRIVTCPPGDLVLVQREVAQGQNGGIGGNAGSINLASSTGQITNTGLIEAVGGKGGNGQDAIAQTPFSGPGVHVAMGGNGGQGGNGGFVNIIGNPDQSSLDGIDVSGGQGGLGGAASILNPCTDLAVPGDPGSPGDPGLVTVTRVVPVAPAVGRNRNLLLPPFLISYPSLGDTLPGAQPSLVSYTRSVFLARSPLPIVKKPTFTQVLKLNPAPPQPAPPAQKKRIIRGYW
jgi:hypothetical protein